MVIELRRASTEDLDAALPLVSAYRAFYEQEPDLERERAMIEANVRDGRSVMFLASNGTGAVGFVQLFRTYSTVHLGPQLILEDLFVDPNVRRGGIAIKLLERSIAYAREIGATGMFLETAMDNAAAQAAYERAGWTREGKFYKYNAPLG